ncbi:MAG: YbhB/YbcL family Raf kinase inhibitor-like protein [Microbacterium gubbeenense]|uniref:YbhB/YbcL family Raf kinase inhibitor-like protein n=2 Tax=Microbacterium gubbeenense TaxID=159896 RepID=UPI0004907DBE|nr:YbhB/YbcL family Raf kinase inhibitor-like protein [Microbacterium gubbeenense]
MAITVSSPDFANRTRMPDALTADFGSTAPVIEVTGVPAEAVELALVCHDPDAPMPLGFTHWTVYGIPADATRIAGDTGRQGVTSAGESGYFGPQPPVGHGDHSYYFWVYALSRRVEGEPTSDEFLHDYADDILEQNRIVGYYSR